MMNLRFLLPKRVRRYWKRAAIEIVENLERNKLAPAFLGHDISTYPLPILRTLASIKSLLPEVPDTLIDVGAHKAEFARAASYLLGFRRAVCIEPDSEFIDTIRARLQDRNATILNVALSDHDGQSILHLHQARSMSSLLPSNREILDAKFPGDSHGAITERVVPVRTMDGVMEEIKDREDSSYFVKLDTQGTELDILRSARCTLSRTQGCLVEHMFCTPYATRYDFRDLIDFMDDNGLPCVGVLEVFRRPTHEISGVDFLFMRPAVKSATCG